MALFLLLNHLSLPRKLVIVPYVLPNCYYSLSLTLGASIDSRFAVATICEDIR